MEKYWLFGLNGSACCSVRFPVCKLFTFGPILEQLQMLRVISAQTSSSLGQQLMEQLYKKCCKACLHFLICYMSLHFVQQKCFFIYLEKCTELFVSFGEYPHQFNTFRN